MIDDKKIDKHGLPEELIEKPSVVGDIAHAAGNSANVVVEVPSRTDELTAAVGVESGSKDAKILCEATNVLGKAGFRLKIGDETFFAGNSGPSLDIDPAILKRALPKIGAVIGVMTLFPSVAYGQGFQVGDVPNIDSVAIHGIDTGMLVVLLTLLGIGVSAAIMYVKKRNKKIPPDKNKYTIEDQTQKQAKAAELISVATNSPDPKEKKAAMETLSNVLFQDIPDAGADVQNLNPPTEADLQGVFEAKKYVDSMIFSAVTEIEAAMSQDNSGNLKKLEKQKELVIGVVANHLHLLEEKYNTLYGAVNTLKSQNKEYLSQLYLQELLKIANTKQLLKLKQKIWLGIYGGDKFKLLKSKAKNSNDPYVQLLGLEQKAKELLDKQSQVPPDEFAAKLSTLEEEYSKINSSVDSNEQKNVMSFGKNGFVILQDKDGKFNSQTSIGYVVENLQGEHKEYSIALAEGESAEIWQTENGQAFINFYKEGDLQKSTEIIVKGLNISTVPAANGPSQKPETLEEWTENVRDIPFEPISAEFPEEAGALISNIAALASSEVLKNDSLIGTKVDIDHDAIEHNILKIDTAFYEGKPVVAFRFDLSPAWHKQVLKHLLHKKTVSSIPVTFNFENDKGNKMDINQKAHRFTVKSKNGISAHVFVPGEHDGNRAIATSIRVFVSKDQKPTKIDFDEIFKQAIAAMGLAKHVTVPTPASRKDLQQKLKNKRKEPKNASGKKYDVSAEYATEGVEGDSVEELKKAGLNSVYHHLNASDLVSVLKAGRILATTQRWSKGVFTTGMSSSTDITTGGASSTFTRVLTNNAVDNGAWYNSGKPALVFAPEIFERLDCYCYAHDAYGSTVPGTFDGRISPKELVAKMSGYYSSSNEVMFNDSVDFKHLRNIVVADPQGTIKQLKTAGITHIGNKSIESMVVGFDQFKTLNKKPQ